VSGKATAGNWNVVVNAQKEKEPPKKGIKRRSFTKKSPGGEGGTSEVRPVTKRKKRKGEGERKSTNVKAVGFQERGRRSLVGTEGYSEKVAMKLAEAQKHRSDEETKSVEGGEGETFPP